jgi:hypothetical protein
LPHSPFDSHVRRPHTHSRYLDLRSAREVAASPSSSSAGLVPPPLLFLWPATRETVFS